MGRVRWGLPFCLRRYPAFGFLFLSVGLFGRGVFQCFFLGGGGMFFGHSTCVFMCFCFPVLPCGGSFAISRVSIFDCLSASVFQETRGS